MQKWFVVPSDEKAPNKPLPIYAMNILLSCCLGVIAARIDTYIKRLGCYCTLADDNIHIYYKL